MEADIVQVMHARTGMMDHVLRDIDTDPIATVRSQFTAYASDSTTQFKYGVFFSDIKSATHLLCRPASR
jgi:hypothetical protein